MTQKSSKKGTGHEKGRERGGRERPDTCLEVAGGGITWGNSPRALREVRNGGWKGEMGVLDQHGKPLQEASLEPSDWWSSVQK